MKIAAGQVLLPSVAVIGDVYEFLDAMWHNPRRADKRHNLQQSLARLRQFSFGRDWNTYMRLALPPVGSPGFTRTNRSFRECVRWIATTEPTLFNVDDVMKTYTGGPELVLQGVYGTLDHLLDAPNFNNLAAVEFKDVRYNGIKTALVIENFQKSPRAVIRLSRGFPNYDEE
jgi:hypothetical protein